MYRVDVYSKDHIIGRCIGDDSNCCAVVSLSCVTGNSFSQCYRYLSKFGRVFGCGMYRSDVELSFSALTKFKVVKSPYTLENRITIKDFCKKHGKGKFFCGCRGHYFTVIDGVLYDHSDKLRRQITFSYRFYSEDDLKEIAMNKTNGVLNEDR